MSDSWISSHSVLCEDSTQNRLRATLKQSRMKDLLYWPRNHKPWSTRVQCCIWWTCWSSLAPPLRWISPLSQPLGLQLMLFFSRYQQHELSVTNSEYILTKKHQQQHLVKSWRYLEPAERFQYQHISAGAKLLKLVQINFLVTRNYPQVNGKSLVHRAKTSHNFWRNTLTPGFSLIYLKFIKTIPFRLESARQRTSLIPGVK